MEWAQFTIFFLSVFGLFIWNRTESRTDARHMDAKIESNRNLIMAIHEESRTSMDAHLQAIHAEIKDFHGRLCAIEERNRGK